QERVLKRCAFLLCHACLSPDFLVGSSISKACGARPVVRNGRGSGNSASCDVMVLTPREIKDRPPENGLSEQGLSTGNRSTRALPAHRKQPDFPVLRIISQRSDHFCRKPGKI